MKRFQQYRRIRDWQSWSAKATKAALILPLTLGWAVGATAQGLRSEADKDTVRISHAGSLLLEYRHSPGPYKPYVRQWFTPGGSQVLRDAPHDHLHHHALMFAIGVDDVDFWGENAMQKPGRQVPQSDVRVEATAIDGRFRATIRQIIDWTDAEKTPLLVENRAITLHRDERLGASLLAWESELRPAEGKGSAKLWGQHYFGLGLRMVESMDKAGTFTNPTGQPGETYRGTEKMVRARWCAYTAPVDGRPVTIAMFDHPENSRHPATWFTMTSPFAYVSATLALHNEPMELKAGDPLRLRYGAALWDGNVEADQIERVYRSWLAESKTAD